MVDYSDVLFSSAPPPFLDSVSTASFSRASFLVFAKPIGEQLIF